MTNDAFELLRAANPLPEDPPAPPITPLLDRVSERESQPPAGRKRSFLTPGGPKRPKANRRRIGLAVGAVVVPAALVVVSLTGSTVTSNAAMMYRASR